MNDSEGKQVLVLGAGRQGTAAAFDLLRGGFAVRLADTSEEALEAACRRLGLPREAGIVADLASAGEILPLLREADGAVFAADYALNRQLTEWAIEARCHAVDFGGNHTVVKAQHELSREAEAAGVAIVPDTGLTPGLAGVLVAGGVRALDRAEAAEIRVGGLPQDPRPPLDYALLFSVRGLTNEYLEPSVVLHEGRVETRPGLGGLETLQFHGATYEAFYTSGGVSTLPETFGDRLRELDCKTIRYPGHAEKMNLLRELGFFREEPVETGGVKVAPRRVLEALLERVLPHDVPDVTLLRVRVTGGKDGRKAAAVYEMVDRYDEMEGFTSMQRCTAWPGTAILRMILTGEIRERGVLYQELSVDPDRLIAELAERGIRIEFRLETGG